MVSNRNAVNVISFSGSSSNGWQLVNTNSFRDRNSAYLTLEQVPYLLLDTFAFTQQALVDCQTFQTALAASHIVDFGCAILNGTSKKILSVCSDVVTLGLYCCPKRQHTQPLE